MINTTETQLVQWFTSVERTTKRYETKHTYVWCFIVLFISVCRLGHDVEAKRCVWISQIYRKWFAGSIELPNTIIWYRIAHMLSSNSSNKRVSSFSISSPLTLARSLFLFLSLRSLVCGRFIHNSFAKLYSRAFNLNLNTLNCSVWTGYVFACARQPLAIFTLCHCKTAKTTTLVNWCLCVCVCLRVSKTETKSLYFVRLNLKFLLFSYSFIFRVVVVIGMENKYCRNVNECKRNPMRLFTDE